jgi:hypothetical protein
MNPPLFDERREKIFIDNKSGSILEFTLDGVSKGVVLRYQCRERTAIAYDESQHRFLTTNSTQGAILWNSSGTTNARYLIGISASLAIYFISNEYAVMLDAKNAVIVIDFMTGHTNTVYVATERVNRFFFFKTPKPHCILCCGSKIIILTFVLCWNHWYTTLSRPVSLSRQPKANEAARIAVMCNNSQITLLSPRNGVPLTGITSMDLSAPYFCFYDRGSQLLPDVSRDRVLVPFNDGILRIFSTGQNPCLQVAAVDLRVTALCECVYKNQLCFCFGTSTGNLLMYEYESMRPVGRVVSYQYEIVALVYRPIEDSIIIVYRERVYRYSFSLGKLMECLNFPGRRVYIDVDGVLTCGQSDGTIACVHLHDGVLAFAEAHGLLLHDDEITGLSVGSSCIISSSQDHRLCIWTKAFLRICQLVFPMPLYSCCFLNGRRDILVGTDREIMRVSWSWVSDEVDVEDEFWDNYDRKLDFLADETGPIPSQKSTGQVTDRPPPAPVTLKPIGAPSPRRRGVIAALQRRELEQAEALANFLASLTEKDGPALERPHKQKIVHSMSQEKKAPISGGKPLPLPSPDMLEDDHEKESKEEESDEDHGDDFQDDDDSQAAAEERLTSFLMKTRPQVPDELEYVPPDIEEPEPAVESLSDSDGDSVEEDSIGDGSMDEASTRKTPADGAFPVKISAVAASEVRVSAVAASTDKASAVATSIGKVSAVAASTDKASVVTASADKASAVTASTDKALAVAASTDKASAATASRGGARVSAIAASEGGDSRTPPRPKETTAAESMKVTHDERETPNVPVKPPARQREVITIEMQKFTPTIQRQPAPPMSEFAPRASPSFPQKVMASGGNYIEIVRENREPTEDAATEKRSRLRTKLDSESSEKAKTRSPVTAAPPPKSQASAAGKAPAEKQADEPHGDGSGGKRHKRKRSKAPAPSTATSPDIKGKSLAPAPVATVRTNREPVKLDLGVGEPLDSPRPHLIATIPRPIVPQVASSARVERSFRRVIPAHAIVVRKRRLPTAMVHSRSLSPIRQRKRSRTPDFCRRTAANIRAVPSNITLDYDVIQEMVRQGDQRYQCLLKFRNVTEALESPSGPNGLMVTMFPCTIIEARLTTVSRPPFFAMGHWMPIDNDFRVQEPSLALGPRPKAHNPELPPKFSPPSRFEEPVRPLRKIEEILPPHLTIGKRPAELGQSQSPFACRRFWSYLSMIKAPEKPEMLCVLPASRDSSKLKAVKFRSIRK